MFRVLKHGKTGKMFHSKEGVFKLIVPVIHTGLKVHMHNLRQKRNSGINKSTTFNISS